MDYEQNQQNDQNEQNEQIVTKNAVKHQEPEEESKIRDVKGLAGKIIFLLAVIMSLFHFYTAGFGILVAHHQRAVHLGFVFALGFLLYPATQRASKQRIPWYDWILAGAGVMVNSYIIIFYDEIVRRGGLPTDLDMVMGVIAILLVLELTRRAIGWPLVIIASTALLYGYLGYMIPGDLGHVGYSVHRLVNQMFMTTEGIYGIPIGVSATFVFAFILFGAFLEKTGVGQFFIDLAFSVAGTMRGGPAKGAVLASGFMGSISGSSIANTVTTGAFTIPLMKRIGYKPTFAGAVEASASTGGQILPPIMGAAAFIMAEFTGIPYVRIILAALIPALIYYLGVLTMVHLEAVKQGLKGLPRAELPSFKGVMKDGFHLLAPLVAIIVLLVQGMTPLRAAFFAIILAVVACVIRKHTRVSLWDIIEAFEVGAKKAVSVATACACAGIIVGVVTLTGLGLAFAGAIVSIAGGYLLPTLILTMIASLILGLGLPTTAKYIILATMAAPALTALDVNLLAAHLFVLYCGVDADVTPPVGLAAYAGAGIAGGNAFVTGINALKLGIAGFIIPIVFAVDHTLLFIDATAPGMALAIITACIGVVGLSGAVMGYMITHAKIHDRILMLFSALTLLVPGLLSDFGGLIFFGMALLIQYRRQKYEKTLEDQSVSA
ncbi:TRAP transporter permease [Natranaerofaba carboxydovora]|uniref:TRAP transporter permease n=1 Tax=Natranaerofaba carboxydovora TaxID=2742683 RepID=UPI001F1475CB|nr:TRAP transporter permease [Natranaerofaba carboxydovora]UMZ72714.1 C4-dicarboxylate TRAP transporter large permease protein DctM [Natranaerofaba carboxydovora]